MGMVTALRRAMQRGRRSGVRHGGVGVEDLEALNLAPLDAVVDEELPLIERRQRQETAPQNERVIMRRRASDWEPLGAGDDTVLDEQPRRRTG
jgi:hypothetical protein